MRRLVGLAVLAALAGAIPPAEARRWMDQAEALRAAFGPGAEVRREAVFLTDTQVARAREFAGPGVEIVGALITRYVGIDRGAVAGTAYFDTHRVRTLQETLMILVGADGRVARIDVLAFGEPEDYLPRRAWFDQFNGRGLDRDLAVSRGIHGISGATLSSQAATDAARRVLAVHTAIEEVRNPR